MSLEISENINKSSSPIEETFIVVELQLGDVIEIFNPLNEKINGQTFLIDYIDTSKVYLININTLEKIKLKISEDGTMGDGNITKIAILSRATTNSYAKQNNLLPGTWINIHFGGDYPVIITGEIKNLEEDMIEIKSVDGDTLFINFDYKGIPEDLPIEYIEIREKPEEIIHKKDEEGEEGELEEREENDLEERNIHIPDLEKDRKKLGTEKIEVTVPLKNIKDQIREFVIKAEQIKFGNEELGAIVQYVDVSDKSQRYSIEAQVAELLDDLLSTVPNSQRTLRVLNNIHTMIERFKQLREHFSSFDTYGNIDGPIVNDVNFRPLSNYFKNFRYNLFWILPVVKNIKKIYNVNEVDEENTDIININLEEDLGKITDFIENYKTNTLPTDQNKYSALYNELNPYFTPFNLIDDENNNGIILEKSVGTNLNVIVDNLEDMYSSVFYNNNIRSRRFVIEKYNLGLTKLDTLEISNSRLIATRIPMTNPDIMSIKSFITLPEPVITFSKINLPGTNMLERANLNSFFLNYWQMLKKKTNINDIFIDNLNDQIEFNENNFVNSIKNYVLNLSDQERKNFTREEIYAKFVDIIIPKTKVLFNLMEKYITGKLSIVDVVSYLEPFLVYTEDLTYQQYVEITNFISIKISEYNKKFVERSRIFLLLKRSKSEFLNKKSSHSIIYILETNNNLRQDVLEEGYDLYNVEDIFTNSEILRKIVIKDCAKLYTTALSLESIPLMFPSEFSSIFEENKNSVDKKITEEEKQDKCKTMTISKFYNSMEALENDNDRVIYFDKKYDKTNYNLLNSYEKEIIQMNPEELTIHITNDLMKKYQLTESDAHYLSNTLLDGHKKVTEGQYAILYKGYNENINSETDYYVRKENKWVVDNDVAHVLNSDDNSILCNLQEKCINVTTKLEDKCESMKTDELELQNKMLKDVIHEFDTRYKVSKEVFEKEIKTNFEYFMATIPKLTSIENYNLLKYNNQKYKLGYNSNMDDEINTVKEISPSEKLLNIILSQTDFVKKQYDIVRFVNTYTRPPVTNLNSFTNNKNESPYWFYCFKVNRPLIPIFKYELATEYIKNPDGFNDFVELLISKSGKLSDNGDFWTDVHSGWEIRRTDFDIEEGYEDGFKVNTRSVLEEDAGNKITSANAQTQKYDTYESKVINNIINTLSIAMGINIENQKDFIINNVLTCLKETLESEKDYKEKVKELAEKGKKIISYKDLYNSTILYYTFGLFLIGVQTSIPSVKTRKTHPGCVRSFNGYPFEGAGDISSVQYLACVAYDIRESGEPWNVLKGKKVDFIMNRLKTIIDDILLPLPDVKRKMDEKTEYLLINPTTDIPEEHDIEKWSGFLPPLVPFKIKNLGNISEEFKRSLMNDLTSGSEKQREKLGVIDYKIIQFSLAIQECIQNIVNKSQLLLQNANHEPYLENACCQSEENETTIQYFMKKNVHIAEYNQIVVQLTNILEDVISYSKASLFYSNINTKNIYPTLSNNFDEQTIYLSFIYFCKFKSLIPIPEELIPLCTDKPDLSLININDSIERVIQKLKEDGRNYNYETFLRLLQLVSRHNIIDINVDSPEISSITKLLNLLQSIDDENDETVEASLRNLIVNALDTFDIASNQTTKEVKDLNNFLIKSNNLMKQEIIDFIEKNAGPNITKSSINKSKKTIHSLSLWVSEKEPKTNVTENNTEIKKTIYDDSMYKIINFYRTFIENFVSIFPNVILNKVDYNDTLIPSYYGFSSNHMKKLKKSIREYYEKLKSFYNVPTLYNILSTVQKSCRNLIKLAKETPCFTTIKIGGKELRPVFDERTSQLLYEYYLLKVFINYIDLSDEDTMVVTGIVKETQVTDIFSVDYLEERETRVDLTLNSRNETDIRIVTGNKKELRQKVCQLLIAFISIFNDEKDVIDTSYEEIKDRVFKLREKEKDLVTDRLKNLTDEQRDADTILKINKLGMYSKALQSGLTSYDKDFYDEERNLRDEMEKTERNIKKKNKNIDDENIDQYVYDFMEEQGMEEDIEREVNDMSYINEDFFEGNTDGVEAPEEEYDDYQDYDS